MSKVFLLLRLEDARIPLPTKCYTTNRSRYFYDATYLYLFITIYTRVHVMVVVKSRVIKSLIRRYSCHRVAPPTPTRIPLGKYTQLKGFLVRSNSFVLFSYAIKFVPVLMPMSGKRRAARVTTRTALSYFSNKFPREHESLNYYFRRFVKLKEKSTPKYDTVWSLCTKYQYIYLIIC